MNPPDAPALSVCIVTQNRARLLEGAIASVRDLADEIVIVDGGSQDDTLAVARAEPKARVFERPFDDAAHQKNHAVDQARGRWVLILDDDERPGPRMIAKIPALIRHPRRRWYKFPRYWLVGTDPQRYADADLLYPDWQLRLFRNEPFFRYSMDRLIHHHFPREGRGPGKKVRGAHLFHLDFIVHDRAWREAKAARYARRAGRPDPTNRMYLYEDLPHRVRVCRERSPGIDRELRPERG